MSRFLRLVWLGLGLASLVGLVVLFFLPADWAVARAAVIDAPPEAIWPLLVDLEAWPEWSPWQEGDYPGLVYEYPGATRGPGAEVRWDSEATGDGWLRLVEAEAPRRLVFEMAFQGGRIRARDTITLEDRPGGGTRVTWVDRGTLGRTLLGRLSLPVIEESMGRDLEKGLRRLAAAVR